MKKNIKIKSPRAIRDLMPKDIANALSHCAIKVLPTNYLDSEGEIQQCLTYVTFSPSSSLNLLEKNQEIINEIGQNSVVYAEESDGLPHGSFLFFPASFILRGRVSGF